MSNNNVGNTANKRYRFYEIHLNATRSLSVFLKRKEEYTRIFENYHWHETHGAEETFLAWARPQLEKAEERAVKAEKDYVYWNAMLHANEFQLRLPKLSQESDQEC
jgi:hypothetical protein